MMRVLLWMPEGKVPGGHRVQLEQTATGLAALGLTVRVADDDSPDLTGLDVVHGFRLSEQQIRRCRVAGLPVALSTIWWSRDYTAGLTHGLWRPKAIWQRTKFGASLAVAAIGGRHVNKAWDWLERWQSARVRFELADLLLPNSELEAQAIRDDLGATTPMHVVPNAVDPSAFTLSGHGEKDKREGALYVGRIEPHKNQLGAMRAMRDSGVSLTVMGPAHPHHGSYYEQCRKAARDRICLEPGVEHEALSAVYRRHKVHVLPSWFETTGLVSLEAALCGCNIVTTNRGFAREYFGDLAWYCDPAKPASIRDAVEAAEQSPYRHELCERILEEYTWSRTARATVDAYQTLLSFSPTADKPHATLSY